MFCVQDKKRSRLIQALDAIKAELENSQVNK